MKIKIETKKHQIKIEKYKTQIKIEKIKSIEEKESQNPSNDKYYIKIPNYIKSQSAFSKFSLTFTELSIFVYVVKSHF